MQENFLQWINNTREVKVNETEDIDMTLLLLFSIPSLLISLLGLLGNGVVLWFLCVGIQRNPFIVYVLNLAIADFCLLFFLTGLYGATFAAGMNIPRFHEILLFALRVLFTAGHYTSLFLLTVISVERCLSVLYPLWYKCRRPEHLSVVVSGLLWGSAFLVTVIECSVCSEEGHTQGALHCTTLILFVTILGFGIVSPLMILSSVALMIKIQRNSKRRQPTKLYWVIVLNVMVFLVTILPARVFGLLFYFHSTAQNTFNYHAVFYVHLLCTTVNSSANPYIYFLVGRSKKRKTLAVALQRVFRNDPEVS